MASQRITRRGFSTRRGRPPRIRPSSTSSAGAPLSAAPPGESVDRGTHELQFKRALGLTQEPIDHYLEQSLITREMHQCALHFRWLYCIRYGNPGVRALNPAEYLGFDPMPPSRHDHDTSNGWSEARNAEYRQAAAALESSGTLQAVLQLVIFHHRQPALLSPCLHGLALLVALWRR